MRRISVLMLALGILAVAAMAMRVTAQEGPPATQGAGPGGPPKGPPAFHILPRFAVEKLKLTDDQKTQIAALEKETKAKLDAILTADQQKILSEMRPPQHQGGGQGGQGGGGRHRGPGGGGGGGQDGPPGGGQGGAGGPPPQEQ